MQKSLNTIKWNNFFKGTYRRENIAFDTARLIDFFNNFISHMFYFLTE